MLHFIYALCKYSLLVQGDSSIRYFELTDKEPFLVESWFFHLILLNLSTVGLVTNKSNLICKLLSLLDAFLPVFLDDLCLMHTLRFRVLTLLFLAVHLVSVVLLQLAEFQFSWI